jgi:hypothetical protein
VDDIARQQDFDFCFSIALLKYHGYDFYVEKQVIYVFDDNKVIYHLMHMHKIHHFPQLRLSINGMKVNTNQKQTTNFV